MLELQPGDLVLQHARKAGFSAPCQDVIEILAGEEGGTSLPLVRARFVDPGDPKRQRKNTPGLIVLWEFYLSEGRTRLFRAVLPELQPD